MTTTAPAQFAVRYFWRGQVCETAPMTEAECEAGDFSLGDAGVIEVTHDHEWVVNPDDVYVCDCGAEYDPHAETDGEA